MKKALLFIIFTIFTASFAAANDTTSRPLNTVVTVTFPDGSANFSPPLDVMAALSEAEEAAVIYISGRTSAASSSAKDEVLAFERAAAARTYLISLGVSPLKIMLNYVSAGDYSYDNTTQIGKINNQRVDIELVFIRPVS